jgi:hypothetical protein
MKSFITKSDSSQPSPNQRCIFSMIGSIRSKLGCAIVCAASSRR